MQSSAAKQPFKDCRALLPYKLGIKIAKQLAVQTPTTHTLCMVRHNLASMSRGNTHSIYLVSHIYQSVTPRLAFPRATLLHYMRANARGIYTVRTTATLLYPFGSIYSFIRNDSNKHTHIYYSSHALDKRKGVWILAAIYSQAWIHS